MSTPLKITSEIQKLAPSAVIELFELDATALGSDVFYFHAGTNSLEENLIWKGQTYTRYPIEASGFEFTGKGLLPRPKLVASNAFGSITSLLLAFNDLQGAKVTRKKTLAKYLDQDNFDYLRRYDFGSGLEGWGAAGTGVTVSASGGIVTWTPGSANNSFFINFSGADRWNGVDARVIKARARRISGTGAWEGRCYYSTSGHGSSNSFVKTLPAPVDFSAWNTFVWDMSNLTAGGTDYLDNEIIGLRIDLVSDATSSWEIDWVEITGTNPDADLTAEFNDDIYYIDRKVTENKLLVEFELVSSLDLVGVQFPRRQIIQNICVWEYRGGECGYTDTNYFDVFNNPVGSLALDKCGKRLSSCRVRFGQNNPIPFGSFPAAGLIG